MTWCVSSGGQFVIEMGDGSMTKCGKIDKRFGSMRTITVQQLKLLAPSRECPDKIPLYRPRLAFGFLSLLQLPTQYTVEFSLNGGRLSSARCVEAVEIIGAKYAECTHFSNSYFQATIIDLVFMCMAQATTATTGYRRCGPPSSGWSIRLRLPCSLTLPQLRL
jgi:hypothetical protein